MLPSGLLEPRRPRPLRVLTGIGATLLLAAACSTAPSRAALEADNPMRPVRVAPLGMEDFFAAAPVPVPERARLGRWLFNDTRLSLDGTVACASCHRPSHGYSEPLPTSVGVGGRRGRRKAPSLLNLGARTVLVDLPVQDQGERYFWDGRATALEAQVLVPIADPREMGLDHRALISRVAGIPGYRPYFRAAFGSTEVTLQRVAVALADYVRTLTSGNAPYDRWTYRGELRAMSREAQRGSDLFFFTARCAMCHAGFNFSDGRFHNLGVGWNALAGKFSDDGRALVTGRDRDRGAFKTPALRDVARHAPYMHDGSLGSLRDVVEFYNRGGRANPWRSPRLAPLGLSGSDVDALVAFLEALNGDAASDPPPRLFPR